MQSNFFADSNDEKEYLPWQLRYQMFNDSAKEEVKGKLRGSLVSEEFLEMARDNTRPWRQLMSYYRCAMMEVETKFRVLNEQFSLQYDRNPIETIKTRLKSMDSIVGKMKSKGLPLTLAALEENIFDVAGIRIICSFPEDIYMLADWPAQSGRYYSD